MKTAFAALMLLAIHSSALGGDILAEMKQRDRERAAYWAQQGYRFDPTYMSAILMDMKVADIKRAAYWKEQGYTFDPNYMSAILMDMKVADIKRAAYWKEQGYTFDPNYMSAILMDMKVADIKRAAYWKERGYTFDPAYTSASMMDWQVSQRTTTAGHTTTPSTPAYTSAPRTSTYTAPTVSPPATFSTGGSYSTSTGGCTSRRYDYNYRPPVGDHYVAPHIRSDGSYVQGHKKTDSDDSFWNNWSSSGNTNPYTGSTGTKQPPYTFRTYTTPKLPSLSLPKLPKLSSYGGSSRVGGYFKSNGTYVSPHYRSK